MLLKEGAKALLGNLAGEQGAHGMASAHNVGTAHGLLQPLAGAEADALDLDAIRTVHASLRCVFCVSLRSLRENQIFARKWTVKFNHSCRNISDIL